MSEEQETINFREEVLRLVNEGKIKRTVKYVEKATDETLEKIYKNYLAKTIRRNKRTRCRYAYKTNFGTYDTIRSC